MLPESLLQNARPGQQRILSAIAWEQTETRIEAKSYGKIGYSKISEISNPLIAMDKLLKKAVHKHEAGHYAAAEELYKKILRKSPEHVDGNYMLGTLYAETGRLQSALKIMRQALALKPDSPYIQNNLGNIYRLLHQYPEAAQCYERALQLQPAMAQAANNLGVVVKAQGDDTAAEQLFRRALALDRALVDASYNLGNVFWDRDERQQALEYYREVLAAQPCHGRALDRVGDYWLATGDREQALACFRKYLECAPQDECGVALKMAYLGHGVVPARQPEQLVLETYARKAAQWDSDVVRPDMRFLGPELLRNYMQQEFGTFSGLRVLDLGCGTGLCGEFLRAGAQRLVGVDLSPAMLAQARSKACYDELVCADVEQYLRQCTQVFDLVTASGVVIFFGELAPLFGAVAGILAPGGHFLFTVYQSAEQPIQVRGNYHFAHHADYLRNRAAQAGLAVLALQSIVHEYEGGVAQPGYLVCLRTATPVSV